MNLIDIFDTRDPKCLFCVNKCARILSFNSFRFSEYQCDSCNEIFTIFYNFSDGGTTLFSFSVLNLGVYINLEKDLISIGKVNDKHKFIGVPLFKLNFADKNLLYKKLSSYLIFS